MLTFTGALQARIAELQPMAFRPFSRIRSTASFNSSSVGESVRSHLKLCLYHSSVGGETFVRYCRSRMNCSKRGCMWVPPRQVVTNWRKTAYVVDWSGRADLNCRPLAPQA